MQNKLKKKGIVRHIVSGVLMAAMVVTAGNLPIFTTTVKAATAEPSITAFADKEALLDANNFTLYRDDTHTGNPQKVYFGTNSEFQDKKQTWYIAGADRDGSLVLICDPERAIGRNAIVKADHRKDQLYTGPAMGHYVNYSMHSNSMVNPNHYGAGEIRAFLQDVCRDERVDVFTRAEKVFMSEVEIYTNDPGNDNSVYYTTDKLYLAYGENAYGKEYITVGSGAASMSDLNTGIKIGLTTLNGPVNSPFTQTGSEFTLRTPDSFQKGNVMEAITGLTVNNIHVYDKRDVVPAFNLNMLPVLFASTAKASCMDASLMDAMIFRMDGTDCITGSAAIFEGNIYVAKGSADGEYLYILSNDGTKDYITSREIKKDEILTISGLDLTKCKIWIEKTIDNVTYAKMVPVLKESPFSIGMLDTGIMWEFNEGTGIVKITGTGAMPEMEYDKFPWYEKKLSIKKVVIGEGITSVASNAFSDCKNLTSVTLPSTLTSMSNAFQGSGISAISIPEGVTNIEAWAFYRCNSLKEIILPDTIQKIGSAALQVDKPELVTVKYNGTEAEWDKITIENTNNITTKGIIIYQAATAANLVISTQPESVVLAVGRKATFSITATGDGLTYKWEKSTDGGKKWASMAGTTNTRSINSVTESMDGWKFRVTVTDKYGKSVISDVATLHIMIPIKITEHPTDVTAQIGEKVVFHVAATGEGLTYQWERSYNGGKTWDVLSGSPVYWSIDKVTAAMDGRIYRVKVMDKYGNYKYSNEATITVEGSQPQFSENLSDVTVAVGEKATFNVSVVSNSTLTYGWEKSTNGGKTWVSMSGTTNTRTINSVTAAMDGWKFRVKVTDKYGHTLISNEATLTVKAPVASGPVITKDLENVSVAVGEKAIFTVTATGEGLTYAWEKSTNNGTTWAAMAGTTNARSISSVTANMNGWKFRVKITDKNGKTVTGAVATLTVGGPVITAQPKNVTVAVGAKATFTVTATGEGLTYKWEKSTNGGTTWAAMAGTTNTRSISSVSASYNGWKFRVTITDKNGKSVTSKAATLTVK